MADRKWFTTGCFVLCGAVVACGSSTAICDRLQGVLNSLVSKAQPCAVGDAGVTVTVNKSECERQLAACNSNDQNLINQQLDCVDKLATCSPATRTQWLASLAACGSSEVSISPQCKDGGYF
jgi:hypothetical protein